MKKLLLITFLFTHKAFGLPYSSNYLLQSILQHKYYTPMVQYDTSVEDNYVPRPKGNIHCLYENEYCNDTSENQDYFEMEFPSLEHDMEIVVCDGENKNYACNPINSGSYYEDYEY